VKRFLPLIFIEGATVMAVELCGAKLMAPVFGSSLYVWASILAITLCALAGGYFFGGILSRKTNTHVHLFRVLLLASVFTAFMPFGGVYLLPFISFLWFQPAVVLGAFLLIFLPVFFLGCTSPLFIRIHAHSAEEAGLVSGKVYALSTLGGILSTFLCGFVLIPAFGLKATLLTFSVLLLLITVLTLSQSNVKWFGIFAFIFGISLFTGKSLKNTLYSEYGIMGHVEVIEVSDEQGSKRRLLVNNTVQTEMDLHTKQSVSGYLNILDSLIETAPFQQSKALLLGLGGGLVANLLLDKHYAVTGVEFDKRIVRAAREFFFLNPKTEVEVADARFYLNNCTDRYDVIILDLFKAEEQPGYVISYESLTQLKKNLNPGARVIVNWHGYTSLPMGEGTQIMVRTFAAAGYSSASAATSNSEDYSNRVFVFTNESDVVPFADVTGLVNTDDRPMLELANARANLMWRKHYLRYWQQSW
jgi:spermidine synthase